MRSIHTVLSVLATTLALSACGPEQVVFVESYNVYDCQNLLKCGDEAQLRFDGYTSSDAGFDAQASCEERNIEAVANWGVGCRYQAAAAEECLFAMESLTCPSTGGEPPVPTICETVYVDCVAVADDTTEDDGATEDTDVAE